MLRSWRVCPDTSELLLGPETLKSCVRNCGDKLALQDMAGELSGAEMGHGGGSVLSSLPRGWWESVHPLPQMLLCVQYAGGPEVL